MGGLGSISSSNSPLYVVDGVPFNGNVASISSQDIEELSFLKDASFRDLTSDRVSGDYIYLRSALLYFIEAEAFVRSGNEGGARDVLFEIISSRDANYLRSTKTGQELIDEIILQKRIELWGEGFAWFDLKRLNRGVDRDHPGSNHPNYGKFNIPAGDSRFLFMIPQAEVEANPSILPNNPE